MEFSHIGTSVSVDSTTVALIRYSNIKGVKILENFTDAELLDYYANTQRGTISLMSQNY
jgi:hypothetical protein